MSVKTIQKLSKKVESLTPIVKKSIDSNKRFSRQFLRQEKDNNEDLSDLLSTSLSAQKDNSTISPEIITTITKLRSESNFKDQIIIALVKKNKELSEEIEEAGNIFKNIDPSSLRSAVIASGVGASILGTVEAATPSEIEYVAPGSVTPVVTGRYGEQRSSGPHGGTDLAVNEGIPLRAISDGKIIDTGIDPGGWGNFVVFVDNKGIHHLYGHVQNGYRGKGSIKKGDIIARVGMTGKTSGPHLHWETGTRWTGGVLTGKFDPLNRYSMYAPFNTARDETKPKQSSSSNTTSANQLVPTQTTTPTTQIVVPQQKPQNMTNRESYSSPPPPPKSKSSNLFQAFQLHNTY